MTEKIPATVITGFLGAGKTTLVRHLLQNAAGRKIALIVNEFGDVGVDGEILKACGNEACAEDDIIELANGCICCTVADEFIPTMERLLTRPQRPDHIIIETSGLALPQPLVRAFNWPEIKSQVTVDGVVTVVDAHAMATGRILDADEIAAKTQHPDTYENPIEELFEDQINCADLILLSKTDLLDLDDNTESMQWLEGQKRKSTKIVLSTQGKVDPTVLLGVKADAAIDLHNRQSHHEIEGEEQHDHDDFVTFIIDLPDALDQKSLLARIGKTIEAHDILRLKGFATVPGSDARLLIQAVGPRLNSYFDRPWRADEKRETRLVVIGEKTMDKAAIEKSLHG